MTSVIQSPYTEAQIAAWLRGLFTVAWADGHFDPEEQEILTQLAQDELAPTIHLPAIEEPISPEELAATFGKTPTIAENFLRTAVMVALADGVYSATEAELLHQFCRALELSVEPLATLEITLYESQPNQPLEQSVELAQEPGMSPHPHSDALQPVRSWLDHMDIQDPRVARFVCKLIPSQCPFERDVTLFGRKVVHIPPCASSILFTNSWWACASGLYLT